MKYSKIVDISTFDKSVDFKKVKAAGYVGTIIRAGYADEVDEWFYEHIQQANKADFPVGAYWFSYAYTVDMAKDEAKMLISLVRKYSIRMPLFYDFEDASLKYAKRIGRPVNNALLNQMAVAFCNEVIKAGYQAGIYFNKDYRDHRFYADTLKQFCQWYAYYNKTLDSGAKDIDLWQFTSTGEVPGIPAEKEDVNYLINKRIILSKGIGSTVSFAPGKTQKKYIKALQIALNTSYGLNMPVDGVWGKMTEAGVRLNYLYYKKPTIKNVHVSWLQEALNHVMPELEPLVIDGSYGQKTKDRVAAFQEKEALIIDGYAGVNTHKRLVEVIK